MILIRNDPGLTDPGLTKKFIMRQIFLFCTSLFLVYLCSTGCKKLAGLDLQENNPHIVSTIDPHIHKSALQFMMDRALGSADDTISGAFIRACFIQVLTHPNTRDPGGPFYSCTMMPSIVFPAIK